jgi:hypothetical protein
MILMALSPHVWTGVESAYGTFGTKVACAGGEREKEEDPPLSLLFLPVQTSAKSAETVARARNAEKPCARARAYPGGAREGARGRASWGPQTHPSAASV